MKIQIVRKFDIEKYQDGKFVKTGEVGKTLYEFLDFADFIRGFYQTPHYDFQREEFENFWSEKHQYEKDLNPEKILEIMKNGDKFEDDIANYEVKLLDKEFIKDLEKRYKELPLLIDEAKIELSKSFWFGSDSGCMGICSNGEFLKIPIWFNDGNYKAYVLEEPINFRKEGYTLLIDEIPCESVSKKDCEPNYVDYFKGGNFRIWKNPLADYIVLERLS